MPKAEKKQLTPRSKERMRNNGFRSFIHTYRAITILDEKGHEKEIKKRRDRSKHFRKIKSRED